MTDKHRRAALAPIQGLRGPGCACGKWRYPRSGVWVHYAETHHVEECVIEDWRTPRFRVFSWLSGLFDGLAGPGRPEPRITRVARGRG